MNDSSVYASLQKLVKKMGGQARATNVAGAIDEIATLYENPLAALTVDVEIASDEDLLGKVVSDLQSDVVIGSTVISGTLNYVTDYTGFSGDASLQQGNYLVLHASVPNVDNVTITATLSYPVTLDPDGLHVIRIKDKDYQKISFTASADGYDPVTRVYSLAGLTCEPAPTEGA